MGKFFMYDLSEEEFSKCLTYLSSKPATVGKLHKILMKDLYEAMEMELEEILSDLNLASGLGKLKELTAETTRRPDEIAWYVFYYLLLISS